MAPRRGDAGAARHLSGLLALFDLDGTLFLTHDPFSGRALRATLEEVYGIEVAANAPDNVEHRGLSAQRIARNLLRAAGLSDADIDDRLPSWCSRYAERYLELLAASDTSDWQARPGAAEGAGTAGGGGRPPRPRHRQSGAGRAGPPRGAPACRLLSGGSGRLRVQGRGTDDPARAHPAPRRRLAGRKNGRSRRHTRGRRDGQRPSGSTRSRLPRHAATSASSGMRTRSSATWTESSRRCLRLPNNPAVRSSGQASATARPGRGRERAR